MNLINLVYSHIFRIYLIKEHFHCGISTNNPKSVPEEDTLGNANIATSVTSWVTVKVSCFLHFAWITEFAGYLTVVSRSCLYCQKTKEAKENREKLKERGNGPRVK